jgi:hypothetical protein
MPLNNLITFRRGTSSEWSDANPILNSGEPGWDVSNNIFKIGNGVSTWSELIPTNYNLNNYDIIGSGNINISGDITANSGYFSYLLVNEDQVSVSGHIHSFLSDGNFERFDIASDDVTGFFLAKTQNTTDGCIGIEIYDENFERESYAILGVRNGDGFLQGGSETFRIEQGGGGLANILANNGNFSKLEVDGSFSATTKSFVIKHPSKPDMKLQYGSLESPYHGIRLTGKDCIKNGICTVVLPDYIKDLVNEQDINFQITNYKHHKTLYVDKIDLKNNQITIKGYRCKSLGILEFFWTFTAVRKDVEPLVVEK